MVRTRVDLAAISSSFPPAPLHPLNRDNYLASIEKLLDGSFDAVFLDGETGVGKTTLIAQFATRNASNTVSLFIAPSSSWTRDYTFIRLELLKQFSFLIDGPAAAREVDPNDDRQLPRLYTRATTIPKLRQTGVFIAIDGLDSVAEDRAEFAEFVFSLLPKNLRPFKFLLSGDPSRYHVASVRNLRRKTLEVLPFAPAESAEYVVSMGGTDTQAVAIHDLTAGMPIRLEGIARLVASGVPLEELTGRRDLQSLGSICELEWERYGPSTEDARRLLAVLVVDRRRATSAHLARVMRQAPKRVAELLGGMPFVAHDPDNDTWRFASEAHLEHASLQLGQLIAQVRSEVVEDMMAEVGDQESQFALPRMLEEAGEYERLLASMDDNWIRGSLKYTRTLSAVQQHLLLGARAAREARQYAQLFRFSLLSSVGHGTESINLIQGEVRVLAALGDIAGALALARSAGLKETRLILLATLAGAAGRSADPILAELREELRATAGEIDWRGQSVRAERVAAELMAVDPALAIKLVREANEEGASIRGTDKIFARLTYSITNGSATGEGQLALGQVSKEGNDVAALVLERHLAVLTEPMSSDVVLGRVSETTDPSEQLLLLRQWCLLNQDRPDAAPAVGAALDLLLREPTTTPSAQALRELAEPLPAIAFSDEVVDLVNRFDELSSGVAHLGPSTEVVRLGLLLAQVESPIDREKAKARISRLSAYAASIQDLASRAECRALILDTVRALDRDMVGEQSGEAFEPMPRELASDLEALIDGTFDHDRTLADTLAPLARGDAQLFEATIARINTQPRRDSAIRATIAALVEGNWQGELMTRLWQWRGQIQNRAERDASLGLLAGWFTSRPRARGDVEAWVPKLIDEAELAVDGLTRARVTGSLVQLLSEGATTGRSKILEQARASLDASLERFDEPWIQQRALLETAWRLAAADPEASLRYVRRAQQLKLEGGIASTDSAYGYIELLLVAIRAFGALIPSGLDNQVEFGQLARAIALVDSPGRAALLWARVAEEYWLVGRTERASELVEQHVRSLLSRVQGGDLRERFVTTMEAAPALYVTSAEATLELIRGLPGEYRDDAVGRISRFLLRRQRSGDPFHVGKRYPARCEYPDLLTALGLCKEMQADWAIFNVIDEVCRVAGALKRERRLTEEQRASLVRRIRGIAADCLPAKNFIQHEGYVVLCDAWLVVLGTKRWVDAEPVLARARTIANIADRAFALSMCGRILYQIDSDRAAQCFEESARVISEMPRGLDQVERYEGIASDAADCDSALAHKALIQAVQGLRGEDASQSAEVMKDVVNIASRLDKRIGESLVQALDNDPSRARAKAELLRAKKSRDIQRELVSGAETSVTETAQRMKDIGWRTLGELNGDAQQPIRVEGTPGIMLALAHTPIRAGIWGFDLLIENFRRLYSKNEMASTLILPSFRATMSAADLMADVIGLTASPSLGEAIARIDAMGSGESILVGPGERAKAEAFIRAWLREDAGQVYIVHDPYFSESELWCTRLLLMERPGAEVVVIGCRRHLGRAGKSDDLEDSYRKAWSREGGSEDDDVTIIAASAPDSGEPIIKDRWIVSDCGGLRLGGSLNGLGGEKEMELSRLTAAEWQTVHQRLSELRSMRQRGTAGRRVEFRSFTV